MIRSASPRSGTHGASAVMRPNRRWGHPAHPP